jgi:hypothetical protein
MALLIFGSIGGFILLFILRGLWRIFAGSGKPDAPAAASGVRQRVDTALTFLIGRLGRTLLAVVALIVLVALLTQALQ